MSKFNLVCVFIVAACIKAVLTSEGTAQLNQEESIVERTRTAGRAYSVSTCDYKSQVGYTCLSCQRALHCYPGNIAILVDCYGMFRHCRDGRCSRYQNEKCLSDNKIPSPGTTSTKQSGLLDESTEILSNAPAESIVQVIGEENTVPISNAQVKEPTAETLTDPAMTSIETSEPTAIDTRASVNRRGVL